MATDPKPAGRTVDLPSIVEGEEAPTYAPPADATVDELAEMRENARLQAEELLADDADPATSAERITTAERYIAAMDAIDQRSQEIVAEQAELDARRNEMKSRLTPKQAADAADDDADGGPASGEVSDPSVTGAPGEPALVASGASLRTTPDTAIAAPARRSAVAAAAAVGPVATVPEDRAPRGRAFLTASAGVAGFNIGGEIDWDGLGQVASKQFGNLPHPRPGTKAGGNEIRNPIASVHTDINDQALVASGDGDVALADAAIEWAVSNARLKDETGQASLVAAGGWCAPSETLYDLLDITTDDGMLDVPGITVTRGGVRYSMGPDFTAVYVTSTANFTRTESQAIAGSPTKPMVNIPCPSFTDNRMVVDGLFLTGDILSSKGYPEAYTDYTQKAMKAFAHYVNAASIADQVALSTAVDLSTGTTTRTDSAVTETLGAVELQITDMRYKNRLSQTQAVEVIAPFWVKGNLRSDLAKRQGVEDAWKVSDADIVEWFALRGAAIQFVYDWQDGFTGVSGGFGSASAITAWPATAQFLIYPQGTFVRALDPVIELNAVYDSTLLQTNQYVALFMEQGRLTLKRHWDARVVKVDTKVLGYTSGGAVPATLITGGV